MAMLNDEIAVIKAQSLKVDDDHIMIIAEHYHTEKNALGKTDRSKSKYRWIARVFDVDSLKKLIDYFYSDEHRLEKGRWPNDPDPWYLCVGNDSTGAAIGKFFENKLHKTKS